MNIVEFYRRVIIFRAADLRRGSTVGSKFLSILLSAHTTVFTPTIKKLFLTNLRIGQLSRKAALTKQSVLDTWALVVDLASVSEVWPPR